MAVAIRGVGLDPKRVWITPKGMLSIVNGDPGGISILTPMPMKNTRVFDQVSLSFVMALPIEAMANSMNTTGNEASISLAKKDTF